LKSTDKFIPKGNLIVREQGRFISEIALPDLSVQEEFEMELGYDADILFNRQVSIKSTSDEQIVYKVEVTFENKKLREVVAIYREHFYGKYSIDENEISTTLIQQDPVKDLFLKGNELNGRLTLSQNANKTIHYQVTIQKEPKLIRMTGSNSMTF